jgi:GNAT superfamily N-acetyltransferase
LLDIRITDSLDENELQPLMKASVDEGYDFIQKLWDEYQSGVNRFDAQGAVLIGVYDGDTLIGIGGIHPDPYLKLATIGRVRHVYVLPEHRREGVGRLLMNALIEHARKQFEFLTLRTPTTHGDAFYTALGFSSEARFEQASHWMALK